MPLPPEPVTLSAASMLIYLRSVARPGDGTYRLEFNGEVWTVRAEAGEVLVEQGEPIRPDGSLRTDPQTLNTLLDDPSTLPAAITAVTAEVTGDPLPLITRTARPASGRSFPHRKLRTGWQ